MVRKLSRMEWGRMILFVLFLQLIVSLIVYTEVVSGAVSSRQHVWLTLTPTTSTTSLYYVIGIGLTWRDAGSCRTTLCCHTRSSKECDFSNEFIFSEDGKWHSPEWNGWGGIFWLATLAPPSGGAFLSFTDLVIFHFNTTAQNNLGVVQSIIFNYCSYQYKF